MTSQNSDLALLTPTSALPRFEPEASDGANAGLHIIHDLLLPVKKNHPEASYSDIWALAGACAVEWCGGPEIPFRLGRADADPAVCPLSAVVPANGRLPDASQGATHLREVGGWRVECAPCSD